MEYSVAQLAALLLMLIFGACYSPQEGCLDPEAENYTLTADEPCCCDYPDRGLILELRWDSLSFRVNRDYENAFGDTFRITTLRYAAHGFHWYYGADNEQVEERLAGRDPSSGTPVSYPDDWVLIETGVSSVTAGTVRRYGTVDSFRMYLGWGADDPQELALRPPSRHPLDTVSSPLYDRAGQAWYALAMTVIYGNGSRDTALFRIPVLEIPVTLDAPFFQGQGKDHSLRLQVDIKNWFHDVDWGLPETEVNEAIVGRMSSSHKLSAE